MGEEITRARREAEVEVAEEGVGQCRSGRAGAAEREESAEDHGSQSQFYRFKRSNLLQPSHFPTRGSESQREVTILSPRNSCLVELN